MTEGMVLEEEVNEEGSSDSESEVLWSYTAKEKERSHGIKY